jgi:tRNA 2-selenouridine synthase
MKVEQMLDRDCILIDVRSPGEFAQGSIPGSVNVPIFDDEERALIGTLYKQAGADKAKQRGVEIVSTKLADIYKKIGSRQMEGKDIVMYCSRGGMRSGSLVKLLDALGHRVYQLEGGYKSYRQYVLEGLDLHLQSKRVVVIHGDTGVGKTEILKRLQQMGFPAVDLEGMANSRGSIFGTVGLGQPRKQKDFDALLFYRLRQIEHGYIIVESESSRVGQVYLPHALIRKMKEGVHILVQCSIETRIERIVDEYTQKVNTTDEIRDSIKRLQGELGKRRTAELLELLDNGDYRSIVKFLLQEHYDPKYRHSEKMYRYCLTLNGEDIDRCASEIAQYLMQHV